MGTKLSSRSPISFPLLTLLAGMAIAPQPAHSGVETIDHIVAVVNENVVTRHELDEMLSAMLKQLQKQGYSLPRLLCWKSSFWSE